MSRTLAVHSLPLLVQPEEFRSTVAVVIDVLRASTTIVQALASGAQAVIPCAEVDEARTLAAGLPANTTLLGGERDGVRIPGFDLGNSPGEYAPERMAGKTVVFTTTNGTRALLHAALARRVFLGALVNVSAVVDVLARETGPIHILCAGTRGEITSEDIVCAGAIVDGFCGTKADQWVLNDEAEVARGFYTAHRGNLQAVERTLSASRGGRDLLELGFAEDIQRAARLDEFHVVPEYVPRVGRIEAVRSGTLHRND